MEPDVNTAELSVNLDKWPYEVGSYTPAEVRQYAVADEAWQKFRLSLKGVPTKEKLAKLAAYRRAKMQNGKLPRRYQVQIDNYINALKRGGQLSLDFKVRR